MNNVSLSFKDLSFLLKALAKLRAESLEARSFMFSATGADLGAVPRLEREAADIEDLQHRLTTVALERYCHELASATTSDQTQRKRLLRKGKGIFVVDRRYFFSGEKEQVIYEGVDLDEAVRVYNGLS